MSKKFIKNMQAVHDCSSVFGTIPVVWFTVRNGSTANG